MSGNLLTPSERKKCKAVTKRNDIYAQRAKALLALDDGLLQREAGEKSDLTLGQVKYVVSAFRAKGLNLFPPETFLSSASLEKDALLSEAPATLESTSQADVASVPTEVAKAEETLTEEDAPLPEGETKEAEALLPQTKPKKKKKKGKSKKSKKSEGKKNKSGKKKKKGKKSKKLAKTDSIKKAKKK